MFFFSLLLWCSIASTKVSVLLILAYLSATTVVVHHAGGRWSAFVWCGIAPIEGFGKHGQDSVPPNVARARQQIVGEGAAGPRSRVHGGLGRVRRQLAGKGGGFTLRPDVCYDNLVFSLS